jgi:hypothetical protein
MLKFTHAQIDELARRQREQFYVRLATHLRRSYGARLGEMSDDQLAAFVKNITATAPRWGLHKESEIAEITMLVMEIKLATNARAMPEWFSKTVQNSDINASSKLYQLVRQWHEALGRLQLYPATRTLA